MIIHFPVDIAKSSMHFSALWEIGERVPVNTRLLTLIAPQKSLFARYLYSGAFAAL